MSRLVSLLGSLLLLAPTMQAYAAGIDQETVHVQYYQTGFSNNAADLGSFVITDAPTVFEFAGLSLSISSSQLSFSVLQAMTLIGSRAGFEVTKLTNGSFAGDFQKISGDPSVNYATTGNLFGISISGIAARNTTSFSIPSVPSAVPEPESYAMLLAGLGVMVTVARRRRHSHRRSSAATFV